MPSSDRPLHFTEPPMRVLAQAVDDLELNDAHFRELARRALAAREPEFKPSEPLFLGGDIVGNPLPGEEEDPFTRGSVVIDTRRAVLLDDVAVAVMHGDGPETDVGALLLSGPVNGSQRSRARVLFLASPQDCARISVELVGMAQRAGGAFAVRFAEAMVQAGEGLPKEER